MFSYAQRICVFTLAATGLFAQAPAPALGGETRTSGMVGLAEGQMARFNVLNVATPSTATAAVCAATLAFYDANGAVLKSATVPIAAGKAGYLDLFGVADLSLAATQRKDIRASFSVPLVPSTTVTAASATFPPVCALIGTLEIVDLLTGKTSVIAGGMHLVVNGKVKSAND